MKLQLHMRGVDTDHTTRDFVQRRLRAMLGEKLHSLSEIRVQIIDLAPDTVACTIRAWYHDREFVVNACREDAATTITRACMLLRKELPRRRPSRPAGAVMALACN